MSAPKWTPGPYEVYEAYGRRDNVGAKDGHVATCEREEDAPLLAAAPEMYEENALKDTALRRIYAAAQAIYTREDEPISAAQDICNMVLDALDGDAPRRWKWKEFEFKKLRPHRALAKARGES